MSRMHSNFKFVSDKLNVAEYLNTLGFIVSWDMTSINYQDHSISLDIKVKESYQVMEALTNSAKIDEMLKKRVSNKTKIYCKVNYVED